MPIKISVTTTRSGPSLRDEMSFPIKCPKCGHEIPQTLAQIKDDPILVCSACGESFAIKSDGTAREVADKIDDLDRAWDKLIKG